MKNLFNFNFSHLKGDLMGGITAGIVALPLSLAFGVSSGLGPTAGLYGAILVSFFASFFGGTNTQISGPTAPMTAVSMVVVAGVIADTNGDLSKALPIILSVFLLAGLFQIVFGLIGFGKYIKYIPYPVVSGFMTAIGVIILATQIIPAVGYYPSEDAQFVNKFKPYAEEVILKKILEQEAKEGILVLEDLKITVEKAAEITPDQILLESKSLAKDNASGVIGSIRVLPLALQRINWLEFILAFSTIVIIYTFKKITKAIPSSLVALLVVTGVAVGFNLDYRTIESIPTGFPRPYFSLFTSFDFVAISPYLLSAFTLALLGSIDSLLTSVVADNMTKTKHNPKKELIGQGLGNSIAAFFGGIPGAGATIRTVVNINSGGKTRLSGMIAGLLLLIILLVLSPIASLIPAAVLAGILITVGIGVMDYKGLKAIPFMPHSEVFILITVLVLSAIWNLVFAVGIGLVLASLFFMKTISDLTATHSKIETLKPEIPWPDEATFPKSLREEVFIKHINGPLFFGSTSDFQQLINQIPATAFLIIIRMKRMEYMDQSGLFVMEETLLKLINQKKKILLVNIHKQPLYLLEKMDIIPDIIPRDQIFENYDECLIWVKANVKDVI
ncbi:MAG: SulP family inorganic anion transporter [Bacteroidetes bacterium]|nr:SulP family inorganic anion transporter [Bacteroidota bacterium]